MDRRLRRRAFLVEKVKEAELVGIVVANLSIAGYTTVVQRRGRPIGLEDENVRISYPLCCN